MNTDHLHRQLSPQAYAALKDDARRRSMALRQQALADAAQAVVNRWHCFWSAAREARRVSRAMRVVEA